MKKEEHPIFVKYLTMGVVAGLLLGLFMDDVGLWISLGTEHRCRSRLSKNGT
jgi:hypothetical protein